MVVRWMIWTSNMRDTDRCVDNEFITVIHIWFDSPIANEHLSDEICSSRVIDWNCNDEMYFAIVVNQPWPESRKSIDCTCGGVIGAGAWHRWLGGQGKLKTVDHKIFRCLYLYMLDMGNRNSWYTWQRLKLVILCYFMCLHNQRIGT